jgi:O-acetyl-ADP-ribose deacetylase (regulator of RNase III)
MLWRASEQSIRDSVAHALARAREHGFGSMAFPVIGAGSGGFNEARALEVMRAALEPGAGELDVTVVCYRPG